MLFDFTQELSLENRNLKIYQRLRGLFFFLSAVLAIYLAILILFPNRYFYFNFANSTAKDNSIDNPRDNQDTAITNGSVTKEKALIFDTMISESFPNASIDFSLTKNPEADLTGKIFVQKTFRALFYPDGSPLGFKDGTLLKSGSDYFIVSDGKLRKFSTLALKNFSFSDNQFTLVEASDLKYNPVGEIIDQKEGYPNSSLFKIADNFYLLSNGKLRPFTSQSAFNSQYDSSLALEKNEDFLKQYPLDENPIGFSDGSLISYADSVYIVSEGKIFPIDNPQTFINDGFDWNDVQIAGADEISLYERAKLFNKSSINPAGTIFSAEEKPLWFFIKDEKKLPIPSEKILASWLHKKPILFSLNNTGECQIEKGGYFWQTNTYKCDLNMKTAGALYGNEFRFTMTPNSNIQLAEISVDFSKAINKTNLRNSLVSLYNKIISNYYAPVK
jgi:hypothetical protein